VHVTPYQSASQGSLISSQSTYLVRVRGRVRVRVGVRVRVRVRIRVRVGVGVRVRIKVRVGSQSAYGTLVLRSGSTIHDWHQSWHGSSRGMGSPRKPCRA